MKRIFFLTVGFFVGMNLMAQSPISFYPHENAQDINVIHIWSLSLTRR